MTWPASVEALRTRLGWRAARRLVAARSPREPAAAARVRRILVVLPSDPQALRRSWALVSALDAPLVLAVVGDGSPKVPDAHAGDVLAVGPDETDWRGLPRASVRSRLWPADLDVAITLAPPDSLRASVLVGASPAALRVGTDSEATAGFFDLALGAGTPRPAEALWERLSQISPAVVPLRP